MPIYDIVYDDNGAEVSRTEVDLATVELPDTHPVKAALRRVNAADRKKREALRALKPATTPVTGDAGDEADDDEDEQVEAPAQRQRTPATVIDPEAVAAAASEKAFALLQAKLAKEAEDSAARTAALDTIIRETGLDPALRDVISVITDPATARATAEKLAARDLKFGYAPSEGNGVRDLNALGTGVNQRLGLADDPNAKKTGGY